MWENLAFRFGNRHDVSVMAIVSRPRSTVVGAHRGVEMWVKAGPPKRRGEQKALSGKFISLSRSSGASPRKEEGSTIAQTMRVKMRDKTSYLESMGDRGVHPKRCLVLRVFKARQKEKSSTETGSVVRREACKAGWGKDYVSFMV